MKNIILSVLATALIACGTQKLPVSLELSSVNDVPVSGMQFIDDNIAVSWFYINKAKLNFALKNNTRGNIKVVWDNAAYVDANGRTERIMHAGVKYADRNESQPSSVVPAGAVLDDAVIPVGVVGYSQYSGWYEGTMFGFSQTDRKLAEAQKEKTFGKNIKVLLPIEIDGIITEYTFSFIVNKPI